MPGATSWSFREEDYKAITDHMNGLLRETNVKSLILVDRNGQVVANVGEPPQFDPQAFASLTAADFSANDQLAKMIGEHEFSSLFHQGEKESMYLADVARRVILVALFDSRTTLGLVRLKVKGTVEILTKVFEDMFNRSGAQSAKVEGFGTKEAEDEIDKLFG
ncbi:MAG TPA: roadblock/LC7 domain-containing protein [Streptosporangiaceae bacterium]|nr:roadblock/LC7 domain-containing protein [Streptosporangiaceae bacterium]